MPITRGRQGPRVLRGLQDEPPQPVSERTLDPRSPMHPDAQGFPAADGHRWAREPFIDDRAGLMGATWVQVPDVAALEASHERAAEILKAAEAEVYGDGDE